jgi:predicted TIM-barrel fold metal-dependent hydrolase
MSASGLYGEMRVCAGIVGGVDLRLGDAVGEVLDAHIRAGGGRYRGVRSPIVYDADASILGPGNGTPHVLLDEKFRSGFKWLNRRDLSFDAFLFEPQLPDLVDLARGFPETRIVLNHVGTPVGVGRYANSREARFPLWRENIYALSRCSNVTVKLGGFGIPFGGFRSYRADPPFTSDELAAEWKPYVETCIEAFGADRCMFASNFPVDAAVGSYALLWNAFKRIASGASLDEKEQLFHGTATRIYRLQIEGFSLERQ